MAATLPSRALTAATRPVNLTPLAVGVLAGGGLLAAGLAPLALLAGGMAVTTWGTLVAWDLVSSPAGPPAPTTPSRDELRAPHLREAMRAVDRAAATVAARIAGHDGMLGASLAEVEADARALVDQAEALARRGDALHTFLAGHDPAALEREVQARRLAARNVGDAEAERALRSAAEAGRRQLETWQELRTLHDRVAAELVAVEAALGELDARIVRLSVQDPTSGADVDAGPEIRSLRERMGRLEQAAARTLQEVG